MSTGQVEFRPSERRRVVWVGRRTIDISPLRGDSTTSKKPPQFGGFLHTSAGRTAGWRTPWWAAFSGETGLRLHCDKATDSSNNGAET